LRKAAERTREALWQTNGRTLDLRTGLDHITGLIKEVTAFLVD
jgi:hypothetical protein